MQGLRLILLLAATALFALVAGAALTHPASAAGAKNKRPAVQFKRAAAVVKKPTTFEVRVTGARASRVTFTLAGRAAKTDTRAPYDVRIRPTSLARGTSSLCATASGPRTLPGTRRCVIVRPGTPSPTPTPTATPAPTASPAPTATPPATSPNASDFVVGIDGGWGDWWPEYTALRGRLGATLIRHEWDVTRPVDAQDSVVIASASIGARLHALIGGNQLGDKFKYRDYVVAFIRRYGVGGSFWAAHPELDANKLAIRTFELGNEPYFGTMSKELYADTIRPALEEVHRLKLPATMLPAARVYGDQIVEVPWLGAMWVETLYARIPNLNALIGGLAVHPYWYGRRPGVETTNASRPYTRLQVYRDRLNAHGGQDKRLWITEYGQSTAGCGEECVSEAQQAADLRDMIETARTRKDWNIAAVIVYSAQDLPSADNEREKGFGLARLDGSLKPAWSVVADAARAHRAF